MNKYNLVKRLRTKALERRNQMVDLIAVSLVLIVVAALWLTAFAGLNVFLKEFFDVDLARWIRKKLTKGVDR